MKAIIKNIELYFNNNDYVTISLHDFELVDIGHCFEFENEIGETIKAFKVSNKTLAIINYNADMKETTQTFRQFTL